MERSAFNQSHGGERIPAIVLGSGITALGTIRCLGRSGIPSICASAPGVYENCSRYYRGIDGCGGFIDEESDLDAFLEKLLVKKAVLIPCSDHWTLKAGQIRNDLRERFLISQSAPHIQQIFTDKGRFKEVLDLYQIPYPHTLIPKSDQDIINIGSGEIKKYFLKPRDSQGFSQNYGVKGYWPESIEDCLYKVNQLRTVGYDVMLQEYIPGPSNQHYYVEGLIDRTGVPRATFGRRRIRMNPTDFGNTTIMISVPLVQVKSAVENIHRLLSSVGYRGIYSAEFKYDNRDGVFKVLEVNARPWWYIEFPQLCGLNVPALAYLDALGMEMPEGADYRVGRWFVNFLSDFSLWRKRVAKGQVEVAWIWEWIRANPTVLRARDPLPGIMWTMARLKAYSKELLAKKTEGFP